MARYEERIDEAHEKAMVAIREIADLYADNVHTGWAIRILTGLDARRRERVVHVLGEIELLADEVRTAIQAPR